MTNILGSILITLGTNWTGYVMDNQEAGIVVTNYSMKVEYEGQSYTYPLKIEKSGIAVWRRTDSWMTHTNMIMTNGWFIYPNTKGL